MSRETATIIFVYNADSGVFNTLADIAHKIFSPETYACNLCAITHNSLGMRKEWRSFLESLQVPMTFLHRDELNERYGLDAVPLPAVFKKIGNQLEPLIHAQAINACRNMDDLKDLLQKVIEPPVKTARSV